MHKFASWIIKYRLLTLAIIIIITLFWAYELTKLNIHTNFESLLPQTHPYVKVHNWCREVFGGANFLVMMLEVKEADIFNKKTLGKIKYITEELEKVPGIDRYKVLSISQKKMKDFTVTSWGFNFVPLMWPDIPQTGKDMVALKNSIWSNPTYYGSFVSFDSKKSLILADFFEKDLDYTLVYQKLSKIRAEVEDNNHILS
ncbi:MAG: hypothetical protein NTV89_18325, partial [Proteobacteria bacterium]|nr:hypothetical protein [Pseudomonadota bacterium]